MAKQESDFRFLKNDSIGAPAAEDDSEYLSECFIETGDLALLSDVNDRRIVLLGRTGTGKTALFRRLEESDPDRTVRISPEGLALTYIANSGVLKFFTDLGINMDPFYKLLWRHVFTVEILSRLFEHSEKEAQRSIFERIRAVFVGQSREDKELRQSIDYLEAWGSGFWNETEYRVKEITQKMEKELTDAAELAIGPEWVSVSLGQKGSVKLTEDQRIDVINRGQSVVAAAQVKDLHQVSALLGRVLQNKQKNYYIIIDRLDENWVDERLKNNLIMGLILTAREFISIPHAKIIVALRRDLIDRVFRDARDSGFQEEKYRGLYLPLTWTRAQILDLLDRRVRYLVSRRYTKKAVSYVDLLPSQFDGIQIGDYIYSIANRPRDVIALFNICIHSAVDKCQLTVKDFSKALGEYSQSRLSALADEWYADYPFLADLAIVFRGRPKSFKVGLVDDRECQELCLNIAAKNPNVRGELLEKAHAVVNTQLEPAMFRVELFHAFYRTGMVGLKTSPEASSTWVDDSGAAVAHSQISEATSVTVSPKYMRALGTLME